MKRALATFAATAFLLAGSAVASSTADAASSQTGTHTVAATAQAKPKVYKNCDAVHKDYPHGFRKKGAHDVVRGSTTPVPDSKLPVRTPLYKANKARDRDKDGVACEAK